MASTKFYLDCRGRAADGKGTILIQIFHNHSMTSISTGVRVSLTEWDGSRVKNLPGAEAINAALQEQKSKIDKAIAILSLSDDFEMMTAANIKAEITDGKHKPSNSHLMSDLFNEYISISNLKPNTIDLYNYTLKKVTDFGGKYVKIENINHKWLKAFENHLSKTQRTNGRAIILRDLRAICRYAKRNRIISSSPFEEFRIKHEETKKRCISISTFIKLYNYPVSKKNAYYRDYFFLMFYLIGINTIDLLLAKKTQIVDGRFNYIRAKTGKPYSIKIEPEAEMLLKKYEGKGEYLLEALDHCKEYRNFAKEINKAIKTIGEKVDEDFIPLVPDISTYFARHTWSTLAHELDISTDVIAMAFGHAPTNKTTAIYIKPDPEKVDMANRKIIDYLLGYTQGRLF